MEELARAAAGVGREGGEDTAARRQRARQPERGRPGRGGALHDDLGPRSSPLYTPLDRPEPGRGGGLLPRAPRLPGRVPFHPRAVHAPCTGPGSGPCASSPASARPRRPTAATSSCWSTARRASPSLSISRRSWATTPTTRARLGEVGKCGVAISSLADMETLFDGHPARPGLRLHDHQRARPSSCSASTWRRPRSRACRPRRLRGTVQNDILKEYQAQHAWVYPPEPALRLIVDMFEWCAEHAPKYNPISISGYHIREAGATAGAGAGVHAPQRLRVRGAGARARAGRRRLRAAALLLLGRPQRLLRGDRQVPRRPPDLGAPLRENYGAKNPESWRLRTHAQTAGRDAHRPAAGEQHRARRLPGDGGGARRHPVAAHQLHGRDARAAHGEGGAHRAAHAADPRLRDRRARTPSIRWPARTSWRRSPTGWRRRRRRSSRRSTGSAGWCRVSRPATSSARSPARAVRQQREIERGDRVVVGVNAFTEEGEDSEIQLLKIGDEAERAAAGAPGRAARARATTRRWSAALAALQEAARQGENVVPAMLESVRAYARSSRSATPWRRFLARSGSRSSSDGTVTEACFIRG